MKLQISKHLKLSGKRVLLIDSNQATRDVRASVLRNRGVEVHVAESLRAARFLWQPNVYDMILLDVRRHLPGEALEFYKQIQGCQSPRTFRVPSRPAGVPLSHLAGGTADFGKGATTAGGGGPAVHGCGLGKRSYINGRNVREVPVWIACAS